MAETRVTMPQLGESVHEGTISRWLVKPGDKIEEFEPMVEVDTDKVNAEVPAPVTGILKEILAREGETVRAGAEIAVVELEGEAPARTEAMPQRDGSGQAVPSEQQANTADEEERPAPAAPPTPLTAPAPSEAPPGPEASATG